MHPADHPGPFVLVDDLDRPVLAEDEDHHLRRVLRLRPGDALTVGDGDGRWCTAVLGPGEALEGTGPVRSVPRPEPPLTVGFALLKGDRPELVVQKLTELGIDRIVPLMAARSVVRWDARRTARALARLRAVARAAAMQCHRPHLPEVAEVTPALDLLAAGAALADRDGEPPGLDRGVVVVGPEGGWADEERAAASSTVALGEHVMRAETAAVTAGALLASLRAGLIAARGPMYP